MRHRPLVGMAVVLGCLSAAGPVLAQVAPPPGAVLVECRPLSFQTRNGAPIVLDWSMSWTGQGILEGTLEFDALDEDETRSILLGRFRVPDVIVATIPQSTRVMLPPLDVRGSLGQATLRGRLVTGKHTFTLPDQVVFVPGVDKRAFTLAIPDDTDETPSPGMNNLVQFGLAFERFDSSAADAQNGAVTVANWVPLEDFPRDPLLLCSFDMVVLVDHGLSILRQEHLDAVRDWLAAGGAVLVRPGALLEPRHIEFLNAIAGLADRPAGFRLDENGKLSWPDGWDPMALKLHRQSLGRVVVVPPPEGAADVVPRNTYDTPEWREAAWFLWRCRESQRSAMRDEARWSVEATVTGNGPAAVFADRDRPNAFGVQPLQSGEWLLDRLIPESVQLVPLWVVGCILALFVVVVGPVDYFLLGMFRLRKLTWALFPIVALVFAWFTVALSNSYMQTSEQSGSLVLLDVGDRGQIVRENELKLYFANTSRSNVIETGGELVAPIDHRRFGALSGSSGGLVLDPNTGMWTDGAGNYYSRDEARSYNASALEDSPAGRGRELVAPPEYGGRAPTQYVLSEWLPQWTPHLHRRFRMAPQGEFIPFDWSMISTADFESGEARKRIPRRLASAFGEDVSIAVLHGDMQQILVDGAGLFRGGRASKAGGGSVVPATFLFELCARPGTGVATQPLDPYAGYAGAPGMPALPASQMPPGFRPTGLFSLICQISPTGGNNFEDLALLDPTDERQWLLLVAVRRNNDWHLYRKLYVGE